MDGMQNVRNSLPITIRDDNISDWVNITQVSDKVHEGSISISDT